MRALVLGCLLVAACSNQVADAEDRYAMAMKSALTEDEKCDIERDLAAAYLKAQAEEKYARQKTAADSFCFNLQVRRDANLPVR